MLALQLYSSYTVSTGGGTKVGSGAGSLSDVPPWSVAGVGDELIDPEDEWLGGAIVLAFGLVVVRVFKS